MTIRKATRGDLDAIHALWQAMEDEIGGPEWVRETWEEEKVDVERRLRDSAVFLAEDGGRPVGLLGLDFGNPKIAHIQSVYVDPAARRRGVAAALLAEAAALAREHGAPTRPQRCQPREARLRCPASSAPRAEL